MKTLLIATLFFVSGIGLYAQKQVLLETKEEVIANAISELDLALASPDGGLYKFIHKNNLTGEYDLQITIRGKGNVVSVFVADKKDWNIQSQNSLKDRIMTFQFSFRMPQNRDYKFNYRFNL